MGPEMPIAGPGRGIGEADLSTHDALAPFLPSHAEVFDDTIGVIEVDSVANRLV